MPRYFNKQVTNGGKKQKLNLEQGINDTKDIISSLPNCMLSHILSFLPTKDAVGTCILSTRWQDLWTTLPSIDFDDSLVYFRSMNLDEKLINSSEYAPFHNFVKRVLINHDLTNITRFRLSCRVWCETSVSSWISSSICRNVKELELFLELQKPFHLPNCLFDSLSLNTLKICMECTLKFPKNVSLPNLTTLHLGAVEFSNEDSLNRLFSGCPSLEELKLIDCNWEKLETITIAIPTLKRLRIDELFFLISSNKRSDCVIKMQLPSLVSFEYLGDLLNGIVIENQLSQLSHATVFVLERPGGKFDTASDVFNLLSRLKHVTNLRVSSDTIKSVIVAEGFLGQLHVFENLTHLELNLDIQGICPDSLLNFLVGFPQLEVLVFHEGPVSVQRHPHNGYSLVSQSRSNLQRLRMIYLYYLHGGSCMEEMYAPKKLVDIAPALEKISIYFCPKMDSRKKNEIALKVQMLLDGSRGNFAVMFL